MSEFFDAFDRIDIVSLPHRADRRREMLTNLQGAGLHDDPRVNFFDAYITADFGPFWSRGSHGCFKSHLALLKRAGDLGQSVLILQDDCQFLPAIRDYRVPHGTDIFYGGYKASDSSDLDASDIIGAHFMGFSAVAAKAAAAYLAKLLDPDFPPDVKASFAPKFDAKVRPPIDGSLVWFRRAHPHFKTEFNQIGFQRSSRSDITPRFIDKLPVVRAFADVARSAKSRMAAINAWT